MELKAGYKQSEVGAIPAEWEVISFSRLFVFRNGINADKVFYGRGVRFVNVLEAISYSHIYGPEIAGRVSLPDAVVESYAVRRGDVLFNRTSETQEEVALATTYLGSEQVVFGGFVIRGRPIDDKLDPIYSGYALRAPVIRTQIVAMGQGAVRANVGQQNLSRVVAPLPGKPEQRAIATALGDVDELLSALDRLIAKKRDLKQAAMQQLLTGQTRLPGFSGEWEVLGISEIADVKTGPFGSALHESDYVEDGTPIITVEHLGEFGVTIQNLPMVSERDCKRLRAYRLEQGDIVFSRVGSVDRNALISKQECGWLFSGRLLRVRPDRKRIFPPYLSYQFHTESFKGSVLAVAVGQTMASLNTRILKGLTVPTPTIVEQIAIATILSDMDTEIEALEARRAKTRDLKQAMMQELLTGRTRLIMQSIEQAISC